MSKNFTFADLRALNEPYMDEVCAAVERVVRSGRYIGGIEVDEFEEMLAARTGTACAVGVSNGLDALRMIFRALVRLGRLHAADEVLVSANTYIASVLAITDAGLTPIFVDIDPDTSNMSDDALEAAVTERTRAVLTVHLYGRVCWSERLKALVETHGLIAIEDNAQAIGATSRTPGLHCSRAAGALGHAAAFSFYPTKNVGAMGDAGAVTTDDAELAAAVRALANYGSDRRYHNIYRGFNCRLDPIQAAILKVKLPHTDCENAARERAAQVYLLQIKNPAILLPPASVDGDCVWHQFVVRTTDRDGFRAWLAERGVPTDVNYPVPPHKQPCYVADYGHLSLPRAELQAATLACLPIAGISESDAGEISAIINSYGHD